MTPPPPITGSIFLHHVGGGADIALT